MKFKYQSKTQDGQVQVGVIESPNEILAGKSLHEKGVFILEIKKIDSDSNGGNLKNLSIPFIGKKVSLKDKIIFTQQLAMMIKSGLPLVDAFYALEEQTENKYFGTIIHNISEEVKGGKTLSEVLKQYPNVFNTLYISIVKSGEKSGKLDEVLERLSTQLEKDYDLISKIKAAVTYPILVIIAMVGIMFLMLIFVVPQLKQIFSDMGAELPLVTRIILGTSDVMIKYWYFWLIIVIGGFLLIRMWINTAPGGLAWDRGKLRIPLIGGLIKKIYMARFARTMGTLVASGLPMLEIIETSKEVISNKIYKIAFDNVKKDIENGILLSETLKKQKVFPPMIYHLVAVGEKSGKLDYVLLTMADFFDKEVENSTANMATLVEPILIIVIGAGVGLVVASVIMPMYSLVNTI